MTKTIYVVEAGNRSYDVAMEPDRFEVTYLGSTEIEVQGFMKPDGCMNYGRDHRMMFHACDSSDFDRLSAVLRFVYSKAKLHVPGWNVPESEVGARFEGEVRLVESYELPGRGSNED